MDKNKLKKILPAYFLIILIPSIFGFLHYLFLLDTEAEHKINNLKFELYEKATNFMIKTTPLEHFQSYFKKLANKIIPKLETETNQNSVSLIADFSNEIKELSKNISENIRCSVFDKNGDLLNTQDLKDNEIRFFSYLWKYIHGIKNIDYPDKEHDQDNILGRQFNYDNLDNHSEYCLPTLNSGRAGILYFKKIKDKSSGVLIFSEIKSSNLDIIQSEIKNYSTFENPIVIYDSIKKTRITPISGHSDIDFSRTNSDEFLEGFIDNKVFWLGIKFDNYKMMLGKDISSPLDEYKRNTIVGYLVFFIFIIIVSFIFYNRISNTNTNSFISIRYKLILLFLLAVFMPIISIRGLSQVSLESHRIAIENRVKKSMVDTLNKIDVDYKSSEESILAQFSEIDKYLKSFKGKEPPSDKEVEQKINEITSDKTHITHNINWIDIRHINQSQIYTSSNKESNERIQKIGRVLSILCLERYCPEKLAQLGIKPNHSDILVGNLLENPIVGFSSVFERPNQLNHLNFEGSGVYWWWNYYPEHDNQIAFCIGMSSSEYSINSYFNSLVNNEYKFEDTLLKVINFYYPGQTFFPDITSNRKELLDFINVSNINKTIESTKIIYNNIKYLCLCVPGSNLKDCFSLCLYPLSEIDYQIEKVRSAVYITIILLIIIAVLTGSLIAKSFIIPLKELNKGLDALKQRETNTVLNIESHDELGQLGQAFNQMTAEIKDMLLAGAVQQCLIPTGKYPIEGYDCIVYNQMAADVGGDYADIFEIPEDKLLIVVGDVTGHGVSSSLLTAMVKAAVFRFANKNTSLSEMAVNISNMIHELLKHKKLMTFCAVSLDKKTGELAICNAGHPYPIIKTKETGIIRMPDKTGLPLGVSKKRCQYTTESEVLNPGETLFIYTDGFPEAENDDGKEYGYENFKQLIANASISNSEELKNLLTETFKQHYGDKELADDITYIILRRNPI